MPEEREKVTRIKRIDPLLKAAGWRVIPYKEGMDLAHCNTYPIKKSPTFDSGHTDPNWQLMHFPGAGEVE